MTPASPKELSALYARAFPQSRPWSAEEFEELCSAPTTALFSGENSFALVRVIAREAELITIVVDPKAQGRGVGRALMNRWLSEIEADTAFLEVASDNAAALHLYGSLGFAEIGRRRGYYARKTGNSLDAIVLQRALP